MAFNEHGQELGTAVAATATITFTDAPTLDSTVTLISTDGTSKTYTAKGSENLSSLQFVRSSATNAATSLKSCIEHANGHDGKITVSRDGATLTLTQATAGFAGNTQVTEAGDGDGHTDISSFTGGAEPDRFHEREVTEKTGAPHDDRTGDFTLNHYKNITSTYKHKSIPQVPFSRTMVPIRDPRVVATPLTSTDDVV